jgi:hypothetical protein
MAEMIIQRATDEAGMARLQLLPHIHDLYTREGSTDNATVILHNPLGEREKTVLALLGAVVGANIGRRTAQNNWQPSESTELNSDITRVITRCRVLFVAGLVFFIQHN